MTDLSDLKVTLQVKVRAGEGDEVKHVQELIETYGIGICSDAVVLHVEKITKEEK